MNGWLDDAVYVQVAGWLGHALWQGAALAVLAALLAGVLLRRAPAQARYAVHVAALVLAVAAPVATVWWWAPGEATDMGRMGPVRPMALDGGAEVAPTTVAVADGPEAPGAEAAVGPMGHMGPMDLGGGDELGGTAVPGAGGAGPGEASVAGQVEPMRPMDPMGPMALRAGGEDFDEAAAVVVASLWDAAERRVMPYAPVVAWGWFLGVGLMLMRLAWALHGGHRLRRSAQRVEEAALLEALSRQARLLGLRRVPGLAWCEAVAVPTVAGIVRPMVLLPVAMASGLTPRQVDMLLCHELAHIRRYDHWVNVFQRMAEALLFFHPAVWYLSRKIDLEREHCCDDLVIRVSGDAHGYADSLVHAAAMAVGSRTGRAGATLTVGRRPSRLRRRVMRILDGPPMATRLSRAGVAFVVAMAAALVIAVVQVSLPGTVPGASAQDEAESSPVPDRNADTPVRTEPLSDEEVADLKRLVQELQMTEQDWWLRKVAIQRIGQFGPPALDVPLGEPAETVLVPLLTRHATSETITLVATRATVANPPELRAAAIEALAALRADEAIGTVVSALKDTDPEVRSAAARALGVFEPKRVFPLLDLALADSRIDMRLAAIEALGHMGTEDAGERLLGLVDAAMSRHFAGAIAAALSRDGLGRVWIERVVGRLGDARDRDQVQPFVERLAALPEGEAAITELMASPNRHVREAVLRVVSDALRDARGPVYGGLLIEALGDPVFEHRQFAAQMLTGQSLQPAEPDQLAAFRVAMEQWEVVPTFGERAIQPLFNALEAGDSSVRVRAAMALGALKPEEAIEPLARRMSDPDGAVRYRAAQALAAIGSGAVVEPLLRGLADAEPEVRTVSADALAQMGDARAVEPLIRGLSDGRPEVRHACAAALGTLGDPRAIDPLIAALDDMGEDSRYVLRGGRRMRQQIPVRETAVTALGEIGDARAADAVAALLPESAGNYDFQLIVGQALQRMGDPRALEVLAGPLQSNATQIREQAVAFIGTIGGEDALRLILDALRLEEQSEVIEEAADQIVALAPDDGPDRLRAAFEKFPDSMGYLEALGRVGDARALEVLEKELEKAREARNGPRYSRLRGAIDAIRAREGLPGYEAAQEAAAPAPTRPAPAPAPEPEPEPEPADAPEREAQMRKRDEALRQLDDKDWWLRKVAVQQLADLAESAEPGGETRVDYTQVFISALKDEDPRVQAAAAEALGRTGAREGIKHLVAALKAEDDGVRTAAAGALAAFDDEPEVYALLQIAVADESAAMRIGAVKALRQLDAARSVPLVIEALRDAPEERNTTGTGVVQAVQWALQTMPVEQVAPVLVQALADPVIAPDLIAPLRGLAGRGHAEAMEAVLRVAQDPQSPAQGEAVWALGDLPEAQVMETLVALLGADDFAIRQAAAKVLERFNYQPETDVDRARYYVALLEPEPGQVNTAILNLDGDALEPLYRALSARDLGSPLPTGQNTDYPFSVGIVHRAATLRVSVALRAADLLGRLGDPAAVPHLAALLDADDWALRLGAVAAIEAIGAPAGLPVLERALSDSSESVRLQAIQALRNQGVEEAVPPLIEALKDPSPQVRRHAAAALEALGDGRAVEPLIRALRDADSDVREQAARALGALGDARAVEPLLAMADDTDRGAANEAIEALAELGSPAAVEPLTAKANAWAAAGADGSQLGTALWALGELGDARALPAFEAVLGSDDQKWRGEALEYVAKLGDAAVPVLIGLLDDANPRLGAAAAEALGGMDSGDAQAAIRAFVKATPLGEARGNDLNPARSAGIQALVVHPRPEDIGLVAEILRHYEGGAIRGNSVVGEAMQTARQLGSVDNGALYQAWLETGPSEELREVAERFCNPPGARR